MSLLTYNVHGLPSVITDDDTPGRLAQIGPLLEDYDWIGVQEDWVEDNHPLLETRHETQVWFNDVLDDRAFGSGLFTLARAPALFEHQEHFDACNGLLDGASDCGASKGFQIHRLELAPGVEVDLLNTHLEAGGGEEDSAARQVGVDQIEAALAQVSSGRPVVFVGDFNLKWSDPEDVAMLEQLMAAGPFEDACDTAADCDPDEIDRVLVRGTAGVSLWTEDYSAQDWLDADGVPLSDHNPVSVTLHWSTE